MQRIFMIKKLWFTTILTGICAVGLCVLLHNGNASAQETLHITRDQFEFRDAPQAIDDTLIGTLRIGTSVEWTGKTSGGWFEIKAPNGQIGWVHESGISRPKTRIEPTPAPKKTARPTTSRNASPTQRQETLEKTNAQYEAQLQEKDRRIAELSADLEALEEKLTDVAQMVEDHKQLLKLEELKSTEVQNERVALQNALKEKDEKSLTQKVELTRLQSQLKDLRSQQSGFSLERIILGISVLFNIVGLILLGYIKTQRSDRKRQDHDAFMPSKTDRTDEKHRVSADDAARTHLQDKTVLAHDSVKIQITHETESQLKELDVVMEAPESEIIEEEQNYVEEDVVIDLEDVLPMTTQVEPTSSPSVVSEEHDDVIMIEEPGQQEPDEVIIVEEPIQHVHEVENLQEDVIETPVFTVEAPQVLEPEEPPPYQSEEPVQAISEELDAEIELEPEEREEQMEELLEDTPELDQHAALDDILEEGDLEELEITPTEEEYQKVEVGGDTFEVLPKRNTQLIESEDESENNFATGTAETALEYPAEEDEEDIFMDNPGIIEDIEPGNEDFESNIEQATRHFEPDDDIASTPIEADMLEEVIEEGVLEEESSEEDILKEESIAAGMLKEDVLQESLVTDQAAPSLLEPSPFVIEPEHESGELQEEAEFDQQQIKEPKYDIELVKVGDNPEHVLHILSKLKG